jgi:uncharacterized protein with GYD domain
MINNKIKIEELDSTSSANQGIKALKTSRKRINVINRLIKQSSFEVKRREEFMFI